MQRSLPPSALLLLILTAGCSSTTTVTIEPHQEAPKPWRAVRFADAWESIWHFDFRQLHDFPQTEGEKLYARGVSSLMQGDAGAAEKAFRAALSTEDGRIRQATRVILGNLLLLQSRWQDFLAVHAAPPKEPDTLFVFARAFSTCPAEDRHFPPEPILLPTTLEMGGQPVVEVSIAGTKKQFLLDTGAQFSVVTKTTAEECGLAPIGTAQGDLGNEVLAVPTLVRQLDIGGLKVRNHPALIIDDEELNFSFLGLFGRLSIDGIIGWPLLHHVHLEIDYPGGTTSIKKPLTRGSSTPHDLFFFHRPLVRLRSRDGTPLFFYLDTGAEGTSVSQKLTRKVAVGETDSQRGYRGGVGGYRRFEERSINRLRLHLGDCALDFENIPLSPGSPFFDGILGNDVLSQGRVTIDHSNGHFAFEPASD